MYLCRILRSVILTLTAAMLCTGCIVIPYAVPPLKVQGQGGMAMGELYNADDIPNDAFTPVIGSPSVRVGMFPLGFSEALLDRNYDVGVGYLHERLLLTESTGLSDREFHGGYLEGNYWFYSDSDDTRALRIGLVFNADYLREVGPMNSMAGDGFGIFTGLGVEWVGTAEGLFMAADDGRSNGSEPVIVTGFGKGEAGIGLVAGTSYRQIGSEPYWTFTVGLSYDCLPLPV